MSNLHMVMMDKNMDAKQKKKMLEEIDEVKGVKWTISMNSLIGPTVPDSMIPDDIKEMLQSDDYELAFVCSEYESATDEVNTQISAIDKIVKSYDKSGMVIGEAPLMKDLRGCNGCGFSECKCYFHCSDFLYYHDHIQVDLPAGYSGSGN